MKHPIKLIRLPLFPLKPAPTPPSSISLQSIDRDRQSTPFLGASSMITLPPPGSAQSPDERRENFLR